MNLKISNKDPLLLENEFGDPMFKYVGIHPTDVRQLLLEISRLEERARKAESDFEDLVERMYDNRP